MSKNSNEKAAFGLLETLGSFAALAVWRGFCNKQEEERKKNALTVQKRINNIEEWYYIQNLSLEEKYVLYKQMYHSEPPCFTLAEKYNIDDQDLELAQDTCMYCGIGEYKKLEDSDGSFDPGFKCMICSNHGETCKWYKNRKISVVFQRNYEGKKSSLGMDSLMYKIWSKHHNT